MFFSLSENDEDVAGCSVMPSIVMLSVGDLVVAIFFSRDVGQFRYLFSVPSPCGRVKILALYYRSRFTGQSSVSSRFSSMTASGWTSISNIAFCPSEDF